LAHALSAIRINKIIKRWDEFNEDTVMIGIFDATVDKLAKSMEKYNPPFNILADEKYI
jgi:peroxiredoxin